MQDHRELRVWRMAQDLSVELRRATRRFPRSGYGSFASQITRAAESVSMNIVEGCGAASQKEFAKYLDNGIKSDREVEEGLELAKRYGILSQRAWQELSDKTVDIRRMLYGLRKKVLEADQSEERKRRPKPPKRQTPNAKRQTPNGEPPARQAMRPMTNPRS